MARRKRRRKPTGRTISPEQQAKMQAARKAKQAERKAAGSGAQAPPTRRRLADAPSEDMGYTARQLAEATRNYKKSRGRKR